MQIGVHRQVSSHRTHQLPFDAVEDAVDEFAAVVGGEAFGDVDGFVDADHRGNIVAVQHFINGESQDVAIHGGDAGQVPVFTKLANQGVRLLPGFNGSADERVGKEPDGGFVGTGRWQFELLAPGGLSLLFRQHSRPLRFPELLQRGIQSLPTLGDGRQSGTSDSPSILNASPESAAGGGLAWLRTGDLIRIDLNEGRCDALVSDDEIAQRKGEEPPPIPASNTPWEELYREKTGQLSTGGVLEFAVKYRGTSTKTPRHNH